MKITVFFKARSGRRVKKLEPLIKKAVSSASGHKKIKGEVNLVLATDAEIKRLNRAFLSRSGITDVIAFNHPKPAFLSPGEPPPFGDIFICLPQARRQAKKLGHSIETELLTLALHGALHLSGMDDATPALRKSMDKKTLRLLKKLIY
jgi:probable rRNA maturation factor